MGKGGGSAPPAPNYVGAAEATAQSQRGNQYTPYGSQIYTADPYSPSGYSSTTTLTPQAQNALSSQLGLSADLGKIAQQQVPGVQQQYSKPMDQSSVQDINDKAYAAYTSRLDPQWDARATQQETKLINQGLRPGDEAYTNAMRDFNNARNDAYQQANLGAIQTMPQTYQLASSQYLQPLNVLNALRSGAQIQNPQFGSTPQTNYLGAAQAGGQFDINRYNIEQGAQNNMMSGLFGLGAAGINAWG